MNSGRIHPLIMVSVRCTASKISTHGEMTISCLTKYFGVDEEEEEMEGEDNFVDVNFNACQFLAAVHCRGDEQHTNSSAAGLHR